MYRCAVARPQRSPSALAVAISTLDVILVVVIFAGSAARPPSGSRSRATTGRLLRRRVPLVQLSPLLDERPQLAADLTGAQRRDDLAALDHVGGAILDDVQVLGVVALVHEPLAGEAASSMNRLLALVYPARSPLKRAASVCFNAT